MEALDPFHHFESSAAHPAAIMVIKLAALLSPSAGNAGFHGDDEVVK